MTSFSPMTRAFLVVDYSLPQNLIKTTRCIGVLVISERFLSKDALSSAAFLTGKLSRQDEASGKTGKLSRQNEASGMTSKPSRQDEASGLTGVLSRQDVCKSKKGS